MSKVSVKARALTYEEYTALPETMGRYEILDGVMLMAPAPSIRHQETVLRIAEFLRKFSRERGLGTVLVAPVDVVISREPLRVRQPDVLFVSAERCPPERLIEMERVEGFGPDLVVEVLSPSESGEALKEKLEDYARIGVRECWLVEPVAKTVEVLSLSERGAERLGLFGKGEAIRSRVLEGLTLPVDFVLE